jgi:hypothetical protein
VFWGCLGDFQVYFGVFSCFY